MCSSAVVSGESTSYPADELFYKGQLLPLHLPPRLQMVEKLLASSSSTVAEKDNPIFQCAAVSSPRRFSSSEIVVSDPAEQSFFKISTEISRFIENNENPGNSWNKKIKPPITQKLKASHAYFRSLFSRPGCSDSSEIHPKSKLESINSFKSPKKKNPFGKIECPSTNNPPLIHMRSFSSVIQRHSPAKCSSSSSSSASSLPSSFSVGSNGSLDLYKLMRSNNASSELRDLYLIIIL